MTESMWLGLAVFGGIGLGALFFGGLWWTIGKAFKSPRPALWFIGSILLRMSIAVTGFYVISDGHWQRLIACLIGFAVARFVARQLSKPQPKGAMPAVEGARYAS